MTPMKRAPSRTQWTGIVFCMTVVFAASASTAFAGSFAQGEAPAVADDATVDPEAKPEGRDVYLGRDVAKTMHWRGAKWLLRETRENEENGELLREWLDVLPGKAVCDLGCGNGYHTLPLAEAVGPKGKVFAVDLQPKMLEFLSERAEEMNINNLVPIECTVDDPRLPVDSTDMVLMVDVYHELSHPVRVLGHLRKALKKGGVVVLVEFRTEDRGVPIKIRHKMSKAQVIREMAANGFRLVKETDSLPWQHAMAFGVAPAVDEAHEARELAQGFLAAMAGDDPRIVLPYLAKTVEVGGAKDKTEEQPARELAVAIGKAMKIKPPIPKRTMIVLEADGKDRWAAYLTGPPNLEVMEQRKRLRIEKDSEGRYVVSAWW